MSDTAIYANWEDLIRFYAEAGVDTALDDEPVDRFAETLAMAARPQPAQTTAVNNQAQSAQQFQTGAHSAVPAPSAQQPLSAQNAAKAAAGETIAAKAAIAPELLLEEARNRAASAATLDALHQAMAEFDGCRLKLTAKNICFSDGSPQAELMVIGDAPGRDDDLEGIPFSGPAGQMLNRILAAINLSRDKAYLANTLPWRPPGNRPATPLEMDLCRPFLDRQIALVAPKVIVALGDSAAKSLCGSREPIYKLRGNWHNYTSSDQSQIAVMPSLHPDYLLRTPAQKRFAWEDWLMVKIKLQVQI
ncbi:uracil-DNA glycosylase [Pseudochrobactrum sp. MP213Fo]|uniref:uracil-DNA glycosylase n=1 Tax=Pseudochrobactrum sp. MP213Fo TaxID=3022250 RepID=UPI003BA2FC8E